MRCAGGAVSTGQSVAGARMRCVVPSVGLTAEYVALERDNPAAVGQKSSAAGLDGEYRPQLRRPDSHPVDHLRKALLFQGKRGASLWL